MHRDGELALLNQAAHLVDVVLILIIKEVAAPHLPAQVAGRVGPVIRPHAVIDPEGHQIGHALQRKRLAGRPHKAAPDQIVEPAHIAPDHRRHPVIAGPLHRPTLAHLTRHHKWVAVQGGHRGRIGAECHAQRGDAAVEKRIRGVGALHLDDVAAD